MEEDAFHDDGHGNERGKQQRFVGGVFVQMVFGAFHRPCVSENVVKIFCAAPVAVGDEQERHDEQNWDSRRVGRRWGIGLRIETLAVFYRGISRQRLCRQFLGESRVGKPVGIGRRVVCRRLRVGESMLSGM